MTTSETKPVNCPICNAESRYDFSSRDLMFDLYTRYDYFSCLSCRGVFQQPMPNPEKINSFYPVNYFIYDKKAQVKNTSKFKQALLWRKKAYSHLNPSGLYKLLSMIASPFYQLEKPQYVENGTLLDVGCGNGRYLLTMRSLGWQVQGVELSEDGLKVCRSAGLDVHHGDLLSASLAANSFDVVTARHLIEHVPDPHSFMAELARVLKPGGKLIIETPNSDALGRAYLGPKWFANDVPRHLILFSPTSLRVLAQKYGLKNSSVNYSSGPKIILNSVDCVIGNQGKPSNKISWRRKLSRIYIWLARYTKRGDTIHTVFTK